MKPIIKEIYKYSKFKDHNIVESIKLCFSPSENKRRMLARNPIAAHYLLERLSKDEIHTIRAEIALNPNTSIRTLINLSNDRIAQVRLNVASNNKVPAKISRKLSKDENYLIRCYVALNEKTPVSVLIKLSRDESENVRDRVKRNFTYLEYLDNLNKKNNNSKVV